VSEVIVPIFAIACVFIIAPLIVSKLIKEHKQGAGRQPMSDSEAEVFARTAERLETRMKTLEAILDDEVPGWRRKYDD
jgi:phage shock protein B